MSGPRTLTSMKEEFWSALAHGDDQKADELRFEIADRQHIERTARKRRKVSSEFWSAVANGDTSEEDRLREELYRLR